jgi:iron complex outermembrane recepter protein
MKTITLLFFFVLTNSITGLCIASNFSTSIANSKRLTGKILDSDSRLPLSNVTVSFYHSKDSTLVAGTITNSDGSFCIAAPDPGNCYLVISYAGFESQIISLASIEEYQNFIRLGDIYLSKQTAHNFTPRKRMNN